MKALTGKGVVRTPCFPAIVFALLLLVFSSPNVRSELEFREEPLVNSWAREFGEKLYEISQSVTRAEKIEAQYRKLNATVEAKDGRILLDQIVDRIDGMLRRKADAVKCIVEKVEELADEEEILIEFSYHSAKCSPVELLLDDEEGGNNGSIPDNADNETCNDGRFYRPMRLKEDRHFYNIPVNPNHSAVHVPTNVFDQAPQLLKWIEMSEGLDEVFVKNYQSDPSLSWQYFGSSVGYLRHYPAMRWRGDPDLFDCRGRPWYVEAASACTKSAVVLVDISGSMTGKHFSIARLTAASLLETFAPNDMVAVLKFSEEPQEIVQCFKDSLVPATRENILAFKSALKDVEGKTEGYANFTAAFVKAFELLELSRATRSDCSTCKPIENEILFLITDNVPGNWSTFFDTYNSPFAHNFIKREIRNNNSNNPDDVIEEETNRDFLKDQIVSDSDSMLKTTSAPTMTSQESLPPVRVVSYLIGKEVFNAKEIEKFSCENRGFSVNLQSLEEVKDEVLEYVPLLATPLALASADGYPRPIVWTHTFADVADPKISRWLWEVMKNDEQKGRFDAYERNKKAFFSQEEEDHRYIKKRKKVYSREEDEEPADYSYQEYRLMTSVSSPAFLRRIVNATNDTEVVADLLGVAGVDVPIDEFRELLHSYEVGVNGYGFSLSTDGNILFHPDLRPVFEGTLKEIFNSVDITEIELVDDGRGPRDYSEDLLKLREGMVNQEEGEILGVDILMHHDDMRRLTSENRNYYFAPLAGTPYTIALSLPAAYGLYKIQLGAEDQIKRFREKGLDDYLPEDNWKVHQEWIYCKYLSETFQLFDTPEERLHHFLEKIRQPDWQWTSADPLDAATNPDTYCRHTDLAKDAYTCDKSLVELLLFDARLTNTFFNTKQWELNDEEEKELFQLFNVTLRFIATHSGLTRWQQSSVENENVTFEEFAKYFSQAIDESWYKQSVIWYQADPGSFIYTMQYPREGVDSSQEGNEHLTQVTATRAIYLQDEDKATPASVVGYQFPQSVLQDLLIKTTSDYYCSKEDPKETCNDRQRILKNIEKPSNLSVESQLFSSSSLFHSCTSGEVTCYILDGSAYILAVTSPENSNESAVHKNTGKFFGEVEAEVMGHLVEVGLYTRRPLFDYQALCTEEVVSSRASILLLPFYSIQWIFQWAFGQIMWLLLKTNLHTILLPQWTHAAVDSYYDNYDESGLIVPFGEAAKEEEQEVLRDWRGRSIGKEDDYRPKKDVPEPIKTACDKWAYRFSLTPPPPSPPPPTTDIPTTEEPTTDETTMEIPESTSVHNESDIFEDETTASDYSESSAEWTTQPTNSASVLYPFSTVKSVVNRWKRGILASSSTSDQPYHYAHSSTTEDYDASAKMNASEGMNNQTRCPRPFTAERIPHSDLVLVVITNSDSHLLCAEARKANEDLDIHEENGSDKDEEDDIWSPSGSEMHVELKPIVYNDTHACLKLRTGRLPIGKRASTCITQHPKEKLKLQLCSGCERSALNTFLMVLSFTLILVNS